MEPKPTSALGDASKAGLEWYNGAWGVELRWTREPDMEIIKDLAMKHLKLGSDSACEVTYLAAGAFNKLYKIGHASGTWLMRVALPVEPYYKTASEVATINFVREHTSIPAPAILAHNSASSTDNPLGFEWMIMEYMPGRQLRLAWRKMPWERKQSLVKQLAQYQSQLEAKRFDRIGNIYPGDLADKYKVGRIVTIPFIQKDRTEYGDHGPFDHAAEWLYAQLSLIAKEKEDLIATSEDEDDIEDARDCLIMAFMLRLVMSTFFMEIQQQGTALFHDDLSMQNVLVDNEDNVTAIVDWECVPVVPLWKARGLPKLLEGLTRDECPQREQYEPDSDHEDSGGPELDNDGVDLLYWEHLMEYEVGQLRPLFVDEIERLVPGWRRDWENGEHRRTLVSHIDRVDWGSGLRSVQVWLDAHLALTPVAFQTWVKDLTDAREVRDSPLRGTEIIQQDVALSDDEILYLARQRGSPLEHFTANWQSALPAP